jgi:hypothetical protein
VLCGQQMFVGIRGFRCHGHIFVVSGTESRDSCFQVPAGRFVVSGAELRGFRYKDSCFQVQIFVLSGTGRQESIKSCSGLEEDSNGVTLLNTDSNLSNTRGNGREAEADGENGSWAIGKKMYER